MCKQCEIRDCPECGFVKGGLSYCPACDWDCEDEYSNNDYYEDEYYDEDED